MKKIMMIALLGILICAALTLIILWALEASEYARYESDYIDIAADAVKPAEDTDLVFIELPDVTDVPNTQETPLPTPLPAQTIDSTTPAQEPAASTNVSAQRVSVDFSTLCEQNTDTVGWLFITGTKINYPVVQAADNEYYLNRNFKKQEASCGALFMDFRAGVNPLDRNTVIYGHNMGNSSSLMLSSLTRYKKKSYWDEHQTIQFDTPYRNGTWKVFAVCHLDVNMLEQFNFLQQDFSSEQTYKDYTQAMRSLALYQTNIEIAIGSRLLTLVTCDRSDGFDKNGRLLVIAVSID